MKLVCVIAGIMMFVFWILLFVCLAHLDDSKLIGSNLFIFGLVDILAFGVGVIVMMLSLTNDHGIAAMYANYLFGGFAIPMGFVMAMFEFATLG